MWKTKVSNFWWFMNSPLPYKFYRQFFRGVFFTSQILCNQLVRIGSSNTSFSSPSFLPPPTPPPSVTLRTAGLEAMHEVWLFHYVRQLSIHWIYHFLVPTGCHILWCSERAFGLAGSHAGIFPRSFYFILYVQEKGHSGKEGYSFTSFSESKTLERLWKCEIGVVC